MVPSILMVGAVKPGISFLSHSIYPAVRVIMRLFGLIYLDLLYVQVMTNKYSTDNGNDELSYKFIHFVQRAIV